MSKAAAKIDDEREDITQTVTSIIEMLIKAGADPNLADFEGSRPLHYACQSGELELVKLFIKSGGGVVEALKATNRKGLKPIDFCKNQPAVKSYLEGLVQTSSRVSGIFTSTTAGDGIGIGIGGDESIMSEDAKKSVESENQKLVDSAYHSPKIGNNKNKSSTNSDRIPLPPTTQEELVAALELKAFESSLEVAVAQVEDMMVRYCGEGGVDDRLMQDESTMMSAVLESNDDAFTFPVDTINPQVESLEVLVRQLKEQGCDYLQEIAKLIDDKHSSFLELSKASDIANSFAVQYKEKKEGWEAKINEQATLLEKSNELSSAIYSAFCRLGDEYDEQAMIHSKEKQSMQEVIDMQATRIKELEASLANKNKIIDDFGKNVHDMAAGDGVEGSCDGPATIPRNNHNRDSMNSTFNRRHSLMVKRTDSARHQRRRQSTIQQSAGLSLAILRSNVKEVQSAIIETQKSLSQLSDWRLNIESGKKRFSVLTSSSTTSSSTNSSSSEDVDSRRRSETLNLLEEKEAQFVLELERLKKEEETLIAQINRSASSSLEASSQKRSDLVADIEKVVEGTSTSDGSTPSEDFIALDDLLNNLSSEVDSNSGNAGAEVDFAELDNAEDLAVFTDVGGALHNRRADFRMSTALKDYEIEVDVDAALLTKLLQAAKSRIHHLKTALGSLRTSNDSLQAELVESNQHLSDSYAIIKTSNKLHAEADAKAHRLQSEVNQLLAVIKRLEGEKDKIGQERIQELEMLHSILRCISGQSAPSQTTSIGSVKLADNMFGSNEVGLVPRMDKLISLVDQGFLAKVAVVGAATSATAATTQHLSKSIGTSVSSSRISTLLQGKSQAHAAFASFTDLIKDTVGQSLEKFDLVESVLTHMKEENKKYVKEILKMRNTALLKSFVHQVKNADKAVAEATKSVVAMVTPITSSAASPVFGESSNTVSPVIAPSTTATSSNSNSNSSIGNNNVVALPLLVPISNSNEQLPVKSAAVSSLPPINPKPLVDLTPSALYYSSFRKEADSRKSVNHLINLFSTTATEDNSNPNGDSKNNNIEPSPLRPVKSMTRLTNNNSENSTSVSVSSFSSLTSSNTTTAQTIVGGMAGIPEEDLKSQVVSLPPITTNRLTMQSLQSVRDSIATITPEDVIKGSHQRRRSKYRSRRVGMAVDNLVVPGLVGANGEVFEDESSDVFVPASSDNFEEESGEDVTSSSTDDTGRVVDKKELAPTVKSTSVQPGILDRIRKV